MDSLKNDFKNEFIIKIVTSYFYLSTNQLITELPQLQRKQTLKVTCTFMTWHLILQTERIRESCKQWSNFIYLQMLQKDINHQIISKIRPLQAHNWSLESFPNVKNMSLISITVFSKMSRICRDPVHTGWYHVSTRRFQQLTTIKRI